MSTEKCRDFNDQPERKKKTEISFSNDPVGRHITALRTFYHSLVNYKRKKFRGPIPSMPEYPADYPTEDYLNELRKKKRGTKRRFIFKGNISKEKVEEMRITAIKEILLQIGYHTENMKNDDNSLILLSSVVDTFLRSFMIRLQYHKDSEAYCENEDLWNILETTLQEWGFHGVSGIAKYFYEDFVRMCDVLHSDCIKKLQLINTNDLSSESTGLSCSSIDDESNASSSSSMSTELPDTSTTLKNSPMRPDLQSTPFNSLNSLTNHVLSKSTALPCSQESPDLQGISTTLPSSLVNPHLPSTLIALPCSPTNPDPQSISTALQSFPTNPDSSNSQNPDLPNSSSPDSSNFHSVDSSVSTISSDSANSPKSSDSSSSPVNPDLANSISTTVLSSSLNSNLSSTHKQL